MQFTDNNIKTSVHALLEQNESFRLQQSAFRTVWRVNLKLLLYGFKLSDWTIYTYELYIAKNLLSRLDVMEWTFSVS